MSYGYEEEDTRGLEEGEGIYGVDWGGIGIEGQDYEFE